MAQIILASSSKYRRALLKRLNLQFDAISPDVNESPIAGETPLALVERLSAAKAQKIAEAEPNAIVIGSDQLAVFNGNILGKPGSRENAVAQLMSFSGQTVEFFTGLHVYCAASDFTSACVVPTRVSFRELDTAEVERYVDADQPLDCAGSFKSEALGISLFSSVSSDDPTALEGLPLISVCRALREAGVVLP